jgi:nitrogen fixation-related uncharacterized protein
METIKSFSIILGIIIGVNQLLGIIIKAVNRINLARNMYSLSQCNIYKFLNKYKNDKNIGLKKFIIIVKFFFSFKVTQKQFEELCKVAYPVLFDEYDFTDWAKQRFNELDKLGAKSDKYKTKL